MSDFILHHYPMSPFSEKIRLIFGYKQLAWQSVTIPAIMPKPDLMALTGGYRRTPVMQIGADIYCDTALIAEVIERHAPARSLYPPAIAGAARTLAQWADTTFFWTVIPYVFQPQGFQEMFAKAPPEYAKAFGADRAAMRSGAKSISVDEAQASLLAYLARFEAMLGNSGAFLLGSEPCIADFSVYHCIWFIQRVTCLAQILQAAPQVLAWYARMQAFGHHQVSDLSAEEAIAIARAATPAGSRSGRHLGITPSDYAFDTVQGEVVIDELNHIAVLREDARAGKVAVHFPRIGFRCETIA